MGADMKLWQVADDVVLQAHAAMLDGDWSTVRLLLHGGVPISPPTAYELRDEQIYRWRT